MFKLWCLLESTNDPFKASGDEAETRLRSIFPNATGYVQTRALPDQESDYSGALEVFFDSMSATVEAQLQEIGPLLMGDVLVKASVVGLERTVMRSPAWFQSDRVKGVYPFRRRSDLSVAAFQNHWWHTHGPIAALTEAALSYTQLHPFPEVYESTVPEYDGVTEISWVGLEAANQALTSRQMVEDQGSDAPNFVDMESIALFMAKEEVVIAP